MGRALIKKDDANSFMVDIDFVQYEEVLETGRIQLNTSKGIIFIIVSIEELESIQITLLRDGYFDFRKYAANLSYFEF